MVWIEAKSLVPLAPGFFVCTPLKPAEFGCCLGKCSGLPQLATDEIAVLIDDDPVSHQFKRAGG